MGFAASQARFLTLTARKSDLELQGQFINQSRMQLANSTASLFTLSSNLTPGSPVALQLQQRIAALQAIDKSLELLLRNVDTQRDAIATELDAVRKVIGKNISETFKTFA
jgi:hypothetical protein